MDTVEAIDPKKRLSVFSNESEIFNIYQPVFSQ